MTKNTKVQLAYPYTDAKGVEHKPETVIDVPHGVAVELINYGRARTPDKSATNSPASPATKEK